MIRTISLLWVFSLSLLSSPVKAMDVLGTEPGVEYVSIVSYRALIDERLAPKLDAAKSEVDHAAIQKELVKRLDGNYPVDPMPLVPRETIEFITTRLSAAMPGAWCVIGHDQASINWLKQFAHEFKQRRVRGCFLISVDNAAGYEAMRAIVPVPLHRVSGNALWRIHALADYPVVLIGQGY